MARHAAALLSTEPSLRGPDGPAPRSWLKAKPRRPGRGLVLLLRRPLQNDAVKVLPGEYFVHDEDMLIMTTLGSCIAACLWDRERRIGGMNHFMLPEGGQVRAIRAATAPTRWSC